ncbi:U3 small nucleolar RNA-associated protein 15-like [Hondaea fermentalgiana]|uniref:U3 small nucleolar RNA-associated protein 15-like n=1 Tax=Hondaea fermentalgiana TaxID=2315210 RepID=A0A2R5GG65_9STRA|nr:U3 small nucleolar RNA-associated protein 15-like [Hondaea fermentalgiana]|eukprot:GBG29902.1 U3 small nucleolar RNA-associated protein 15-like [Hondaea fermentalgiana]
MEFQRLNKQQFVRETVNESAEERYWKQFRTNAGEPLRFSGPVTGLAFSPGSSFEYALASGTRVGIYDGRSGKLRRTLARFKDMAYGPSYRYDGKLMAAGCENGQVYVFESAKGNLMRLLKGHTGPVRSTNWSPTGSFVLSCSHDKTVRQWDITTEEEVGVFRGHTDQVRCAALVGTGAGIKGVESAGPEVWATGSYDHTVKLWDVRAPSQTAALSLDQGGPVEDVLAFRDGYRVAAAVHSKVFVWDVRAGGQKLRELDDHQRTVTSLFQDGTNLRLLSGSLDGLIKVHDADSLECTASVAIGSGQGILCAGMSTDNSTLVVGCVSGQAVVRKRVSAKEEKTGTQAEIAAGAGLDMPRGGTRRFFMRGGNVGPAPGDFKASVARRTRLKKYEKHLQKYNYKQALDEVLGTRQPAVVAALLEELIHRNGLEAALAARDDTSLEPILSFVIKYIANPRFSSLLVQVSDVLLRSCTADLGQSVLVDELFVKLQTQLHSELRLQKDLQKLSGTVDLVLSTVE